MNKRTISYFRDDNYKEALFNLNLQSTVLSSINGQECCFYLQSENKKFKLCAFSGECGTKENPKWVREWQYDFSFFKTKCFKKLDEKKLEGIEEPKKDTPANQVLG